MREKCKYTTQVIPSLNTKPYKRHDRSSSTYTISFCATIRRQFSDTDEKPDKKENPPDPPMRPRRLWARSRPPPCPSGRLLRVAGPSTTPQQSLVHLPPPHPRPALPKPSAPWLPGLATANIPNEPRVYMSNARARSATPHRPRRRPDRKISLAQSADQILALGWGWVSIGCV